MTIKSNKRVITLRIEKELEKELQKGVEDLKAHNPGMKVTVSDLIRIAIIRDLRKNPKEVSFEIPEDAADKDILAFYDALEKCSEEAENPGVTAIFNELLFSNGLQNNILKAVRAKRERLQEHKKSKAESGV